jgi:hypothetical protein
VKRFILHFNMKSRDDLSEGEKKIETYLTFIGSDSSAPRSGARSAHLNAKLSRSQGNARFQFGNVAPPWLSAGETC